MRFLKTMGHPLGPPISKCDAIYNLDRTEKDKRSVNQKKVRWKGEARGKELAHLPSRELEKR